MMQAACYGRLGQEPRSIETKSGTSMAVASLAVDLAESREPAADEPPPPLWIGIVAFGRQAEMLLKHSKGDLLSVSGRVQRSRYTDRHGDSREQLQVIADSIVSARTVRSGGSKRAEATQPGDG